MHPQQEHILYPIILAVPEEVKSYRGREKVGALSTRAREALALSAEKSRVTLGPLSKNEGGVPMPVNGVFWSLTHKSDYVGAVVASERIGIDIERIKSCSPGLYKKTAGDDEWALSGDDPVRLFFRYWTAKEAVIKTLGSGLRDLRKCRVIQLPDEMHLIIDHKGTRFVVAHFFFDNHCASIVQNEKQVDWTVVT